MATEYLHQESFVSQYEPGNNLDEDGEQIDPTPKQPIIGDPPRPKQLPIGEAPQPENMIAVFK
jgi:hypothetical protein